MLKYKVLITTSGIGQRLGDITQYTNKALVRVGKKPVISYIIESYRKEIEIVITLGHFGNYIRDFLRLTYPDRCFKFVEIDKYKGKGSSLGYSMLKAKDFLQCPFIYHASDTLINEPIPVPQVNWNGGFPGKESAMYSTYTVMNNHIQQIHDKGALEYDYIHIGLVGIFQYKIFWNSLAYLYEKDPNDEALNDCKVINLMLQKKEIFISKVFKSWLDIGNAEGLQKARESISDKFTNLDKIDESIYIIDRQVIKLIHRFCLSL